MKNHREIIGLAAFGLVFGCPLVVCATPSVAVSQNSTDKSTIYSPIGKRDPFKSPALQTNDRDVTAVNPLEKFAVDQFQLRAVLRGIGKPKAMFEDPDGKTHIITEGDVIGRERATVSRILNSEVILTERTFNYLGVENLYEKILSLPVDKEAGRVETGNVIAPANGGGNAAVAPGAKALNNNVPNPPIKNEPNKNESKPVEGDTTIRGTQGNKLVY